jgi:aminoglycoside phosphotransferase (APT) family kinase protein
MATLGDPLTDVALLVAYAIEATESPYRRGSAASAPGFLAPAELISAYAAAAGSPMDGFGFYLALAFYKIIGILEGIHYRFLAGKTVGITYQDAGARVAWLVDAGLAALDN